MTPPIGPVHAAGTPVHPVQLGDHARSRVTGPTNPAPSVVDGCIHLDRPRRPPPVVDTTTGAITAAPVPGPVSAVGDSIMLDIQPYLATDIPGAQVDGLVSRQFETGIGVVRPTAPPGPWATSWW